MNKNAIISAYFDGRAAFKRGAEKSDCPYPRKSEEGKNWREGWAVSKKLFEEKNARLASL